MNSANACRAIPGAGDEHRWDDRRQSSQVAVRRGTRWHRGVDDLQPLPALAVQDRWKPPAEELLKADRQRPCVGLLAQANGQSLRLHFAEEDAHTHDIRGVVERDGHARQPAHTLAPAESSHRQRPPVFDGQVIEPLSTHDGPDVRSRRQLPPERGGAQQHPRSLVRKRLQLRKRGLVSRTQSDRFTFAVGNVARAAAGQYLVQVYLRFDVLTFADRQLILQYTKSGVSSKLSIASAMYGEIFTLNVREQRLYRGRRKGSITHAALTPPSRRVGAPSVGCLREEAPEGWRLPTAQTPRG